MYGKGIAGRELSEQRIFCTVLHCELQGGQVIKDTFPIFFGVADLSLCRNGRGRAKGWERMQEGAIEDSKADEEEKVAGSEEGSSHEGIVAYDAFHGSPASSACTGSRSHGAGGG